MGDTWVFTHINSNTKESGQVFSPISEKVFTEDRNRNYVLKYLSFISLKVIIVFTVMLSEKEINNFFKN